MNKYSKRIDIYFGLLIMNVFFILSFICFDLNNGKMEDFIMIGSLVIVIMFSYFGGIIFGLIMSTFIIFSYASYVIYGSLIFERVVFINTYVWTIEIPLCSLISGKLSANIRNLQKLSKKFEAEYESLVTIDEKTGLENIKSFYMNLDKEISSATRHKNALSLLMVKIEYFNEIKGRLGEDNMDDIIKNISVSISEATRNEDKKYRISDDKFVVIMPSTDKKGGGVVKERIKSNITEINLKGRNEGKTVIIDTKISVMEYSNDIENPFEFKELTEKELEYDL